MSHLVLARKYRPKTFDEVVGQEVIVKTLKAALLKERMAHALLFTGSRGIGKTTVARIVAKAMVCKTKTGADPCNTCAQCLSIDDFSSLDVIEIDGASHTGVDDIRDLRESARYQPSSAKYRIFIIDEVHMLSGNAFNALLKIIEEPPPHVMFIFATTEAHKIPKTILSRCQRYDFRRVGVVTIQALLKSMLELEKFKFDDDALLLIAELADGGLRDALSMAEQVIAMDKSHYSALDVAQALGVVSHQATKDLAKALIKAEVSGALKIAKELYEQGLDIYSVIDAVAERFRSLALCAHLKTFSEALELVPGLSLEEFNEAQSLDKADLKRLFAMALDGMTLIAQSRKPFLALELVILRVAQRPALSDAVAINYCLQKLDAIMHNRPLPKEPAPLKIKEIPPAPKPAIIQTSPKDPNAMFATLMSELGQTLPGLASHLRHARPTLSGHELKLSFELSLHYEKLLAKQNELMTLVKKIYGPEIILTPILEKQPNIEQKAVKTIAETDEEARILDEQQLRERAENHPLVKKAIEIFGGDITKVQRLGA